MMKLTCIFLLDTLFFCWLNHEFMFLMAMIVVECKLVS